MFLKHQETRKEKAKYNDLLLYGLRLASRLCAQMFSLIYCSQSKTVRSGNYSCNPRTLPSESVCAQKTQTHRLHPNQLRRNCYCANSPTPSREQVLVCQGVLQGLKQVHEKRLMTAASTQCSSVEEKYSDVC